MSLFTWGVIVALILINALYVAAEFAAVSVRRSRIQQEAEDGNGLARRLLPVLTDAHRLDRYIAACQIGITLSSLVLGAYGQATLAVQLTPLFERFGDMQAAAAESTAALVVLVVLTVLQMVFGELVPKSLALQYPTQMALWTVVPMRWSLRALAWFIVVLNGSGIALLRLLGVDQVGHRHIHSPEEIDLLIGESRNGGLLEADEHRRLRRALQLGVRSVRELMVPRTHVEALDADAPLEEVVQMVTESPYTRLPIYDDSIDNIIGLVHARDVALHALPLVDPALSAAGPAARPFSLRTLARPILIVPATMTADQLLSRMREERRQMAVVVDEFGGTAGLVTVDDVLGEVVGDVGDEFKPVEAGPEQLPDGRVRLPGDLRIDDAEPWLGVQWEGDAVTVAGRIMEEFGRIPAAGDRVVIEGIAVEVERLEGHAIASVLATPASPSNGGGNGEVSRV